MKNTLWVGLDVGSTTVKIAVVDPENGKLLHSRYERHNAMQAPTLTRLLEEAHELYPEAQFRVAVCGSGGHPFATAMGAFFVQEVVANALAVRKMYPDTKVAIELGGQDAKVIFFEKDRTTGKLIASDMRMNGSCAGGTGAFIDQVAELLRVKTEEFESLACKGTKVYEISGRCGVFAKTDIQPLLNQGASKEDIALSSFHAIAKQTIGGLAQGMEIRAPVIFEGGPLTFNPTLITVFKERLGLKDEEAILPDKAEVLVSWGAALSVGAMYSEHESNYNREKSLDALRRFVEERQKDIEESNEPFFASNEEYDAFIEEFSKAPEEYELPEAGSEINVYLGIDAGSTTTKFVLLSEDERVVDTFYSSNKGDPLQILKDGLLDIREKYRQKEITLNILGAGSTGYGEQLFASALHADYHTVETVAHAEAAQQIRPDASFILDIGGQDMKAISIQDGVVTGIILNEACSSGCGSFIETYARSLGIAMEEVAPMAFKSTNPSRLGSRCTVFMNSSIITEQRDGKEPEDIIAGICRSIIENEFTKVIRLRNLDSLGSTVVVQGGTFKNDAVLRAFQQYTGLNPVRPERPGEMGAIGIALLTKKYVEEQKAKDPQWKSSFIGLDSMEEFAWHKQPGQICTFCSNNCNRTIITFNDGAQHVTGNRCERGEVTADPNDVETRKIVAQIAKKIHSVPDMIKRTNQLLIRTWTKETVLPENGIRIGIPRTLEFWASMPFWKTLYQALGFKVVISKQSDYELFEEGLNSVPSDTVCFPAKLAHGHLLDLVDKKVDRVFFPMMIALPSEQKHVDTTCVCPVVQAYGLVVNHSDEPMERHNMPLDQPTLHWDTEKLRRTETLNFMVETYDLPPKAVKKAIKLAEKALDEFYETLQNEGQQIIDDVRAKGEFAVVVGGRPYHADMLVNHHIASHFTAQGIPVLTLESLPGIYDRELNKKVRMVVNNSFHARLLSAAFINAEDPALELAQIVSFGCGHDAAISDELIRVMHEKSDKELLILKLDEGDVRGPMGIRIKSFIETVKSRRALKAAEEAKEAKPLFHSPFTKDDKKKRTVLIPNLSVGFSYLCKEVFNHQGYKTVQMPLANSRAVELGKKFVHNDICFPAQINIGEALEWLESHPEIPRSKLAVGLAKNCENCRAGQYPTLARKALDEAGYVDVPIVTTGVDDKDMHPGFDAGLGFRLKLLWGIPLMDAIEAMVRTVRPYEINPGETQEVYEYWLRKVLGDAAVSHRKALKSFEKCVDAFNKIEVDRSERRPRVAVLGEILMKYHASSNGFIEEYLEKHGMEVIQPGMLDFFRRDELVRMEKVRRKSIDKPLLNRIIGTVTETAYDHAAKTVNKIHRKFRWYEHHADCYEMAEAAKDIIDITYNTGETWLIPAEIMTLAANNAVNSFVILQPFACLANHISGRGLTKAVKNLYPHIQVLSLDYDPDTSFANVENRLQMLIINAKELEKNNFAQVS
ncbi:MAG: CoA activase [Fibrobacter sp.]|nr:CoA activase [Fibrobacter sp.]